MDCREDTGKHYAQHTSKHCASQIELFHLMRLESCLELSIIFLNLTRCTIFLRYLRFSFRSFLATGENAYLNIIIVYCSPNTFADNRWRLVQQAQSRGVLNVDYKHKSVKCRQNLLRQSKKYSVLSRQANTTFLSFHTNKYNVFSNENFLKPARQLKGPKTGVIFLYADVYI